MFKKNNVYLIFSLSLLTLFGACGVSKEVKWSQPIQNTIWELESISGFTIEEGLRKLPTIVFENDNRYGGFSGCNTYFGEYSISSANTISLSNAGMTMMACQPGMDTENKFLEILKNVNGFRVAGHRLELLQDGVALAYFTVAEKIED